MNYSPNKEKDKSPRLYDVIEGVSVVIGKWNMKKRNGREKVR